MRCRMRSSIRSINVFSFSLGPPLQRCLYRRVCRINVRPQHGAIRVRSQGDPRWIFLGLFVRRHLWHDSGRRRFNNLHVALRVFFSIELDLLLPCELNASVLLGVLPLPDPLKILRNPSELLDFGATILGNMASLHDQVVVPAGMHYFAPNPRFKPTNFAHCIVLIDLSSEFLLESSRNAQIRHSNRFHSSWFCRFCVTVFVQTALPRNLADRCSTCVWRQPCPHCRPSLHCWPLPPNLKRRCGNRGATRTIALH